MKSPSPTDADRLFALVPCAGVGARAGTSGPKQYEIVAGRAVVAHTLAALAGVSRIERTLVVLDREDGTFERAVVGYEGWTARVGGATRAVSVMNGLDALQLHGARDGDWVLVHDAARCLIRAEWVDALIDACMADAVGGLLALPVADTLKRESDGRVAATLDRHGAWQAQTPQMFRIGMLRRALQSDVDVTDEAGAMQAAGFSPKLVRGSLENFKVTYPMDFDLASRLLRSRP